MKLSTTTKEDIMVLRVIWIIPPMEKVTPQSIRITKVGLEYLQIQVSGQDHPVPEERNPFGRS